MTNQNIRYETIKFPVTTKQFLIVMGASLALLLIGVSLFAGEDSFEVCQSNYAKATTQIMEYNKENPKYMIELPKYNCINLLNQWTENVTPLSDVPPKSNEPKEITLRDKFWLWDCRFINDSHRLGKYNLEWMGYDIACEKWVAFEVKSPWNYIIEKVWFGYNIWNFIIAKRFNDNVRIVLWHTETSLKEGHILKEGDIIGKTNLSWESTWMHVHIEVWEGYKNVSREILLDKEYRSEDWSKLLSHRQWDFGQHQKLYDDVKELECKNWFALKSYWDYAQYSIGCGTKSFKDEQISEAEAYVRFKAEVDRRYAIVENTYKDYSFNQKIALTSLLYNNPACYNHFRDNGIDIDIWKNKCNKAGWSVLKWLQIRREKEVYLFNS